MCLYTDSTFKALFMTSLLPKLLYIDERAYGNDTHACTCTVSTKTTLALFTSDACSNSVSLVFSSIFPQANFTEEQLVER